VEARSLGTAAGTALAARALLAHATTAVPLADRMPFLRQAEADARAALAKDETLVAAHLQLVMALGQVARIKGVLAAQLDGIPQEARAHIKRALALDPNNPWALAATGAWNLEVTRYFRFASTLFGASRRKGLEAFEAALRADRENIVVRYQYALTLLSFHKPDYRRMGENALKEALALAPKDAFARLMQSRAAHLEVLLHDGDDTMLEATLAAYRGEADVPMTLMRAEASAGNGSSR
jgi:tetratricopeptide (TPR) repeat protein